MIAFYIGFIGAVFTPLNYMSLACLSSKHLNTGASMIHVIRFVAGALGTAFATSHLEKMKDLHFLGMTRQVNTSHPLFIPSLKMLKAYLLAHAQPSGWIDLKIKAFMKGYLLVRSYIFAFQDCMVIFTLATLASLLFIPLLIGEKSKPLEGL